MKFRLVSFTPDPFSGGRFTIGALIGTERDASFTPAEHLPGPDCLGGTAAWLTLQKVLQSLASLRRLDPEPGFATQLLSFSPTASVPTGCVDPKSWLRAALLPRAQTD
jgi:hypothetical protein